jgi:tetratricopeptide (TPR) repeat protein
MAVSAMNLTARDYQRVFPDIKWSMELRRLQRNRLIKSQRKRLVVPTPVKNQFTSDDLRSFDQAWITALDGQKRRIDTALLYAMPCIGLGRIDDAVEALVAIVEGTSLGWWGKSYKTVLHKFTDQRLYAKLSDNRKAQLLNALGLCSAHLGQFKEAVRWFARLRHIGRRTGNAWALGQSFINAGAAHASQGDDTRAAMYYRDAVRHARRSRDYHLLGRALNNLGLTIAECSPEKAERLFQEAMKVKKRVGDEVGLVASCIACGNAAAAGRRHHKAMAFFQRGYREARRLQLPHEQAVLLNNIGSSHFDMGSHRKALRFYHNARVLSVAQGISDVAVLACRGEARANYDLGMFKNAARAFLELASVAQANGDTVDTIESFHAAGVALAHHGALTQARRAFASALTLARQTRDPEWIAKCLIDERVTCNKTRLASSLLDAARKERRHSDVASPIYAAAIAAVCKTSDATVIKPILHSWVDCARQSTNASNAIEAYKHLYQWLWNQAQFADGLRALDQMREVASRGKCHEEEARAIDQRGVCLQELQRFKQAEACHRKALKLFRRLKSQELVESALNNLGELLRKTGKPYEGSELLQEARRIAKHRCDVESEISIVHNLALAREQMGDTRAGAQLLIWCSETAKRKKLHYEYVRALHGLANAATIQRQDTLASSRYIKALSVAKKYGQAQQSLDIAINFAWFLRERLRYGQARRVLKQCDAAECPPAPGRHLYNSLLARLHQDARQWKEAEREWTTALSLATEEGAQEPQREAREALKELATRRTSAHQTYQEVKRQLFGLQTAKKQASFLAGQFAIFLNRGDDRIAGKLFTSARRTMSQNGYYGDLVALHLALGDAYVRGRYSHRLTAMKSYFAAMLHALHLSPSRSANIGVHINRQATGMPSVIVRRLQNDVHRWLQKSLNNDHNLLRFVEWPLNMAVKVTSAKPDEVLSRDWQKRLVADELAVWKKAKART